MATAQLSREAIHNRLHALALEPFDSFESLYQEYLQLGQDIFGLELGIISHIESKSYEVMASNAIPVGTQYALGDTYCNEVVRQNTTIALNHVGAHPDMRQHPVYQTARLESYIATSIWVQGKRFGTLNFSSENPRDTNFSRSEIAWIELMAKALGHTLERDLIERQRNQAISDLETSVKQFEGAFRHASIGMALVSPEGRWLRVNPALCEMLGYAEASLLETDFQTLTHPEDLESDLEHVQALLNGEGNSYTIDKRYIHRNGDIVWGQLSVSLVRHSEDQTPMYFVSQIQDITQRIRAEQALQQKKEELTLANRQLTDLARTDPLTGLANRRYFTERLLTSLAYHCRHQKPISYLLFDIDFFKSYNDRFGHVAGDKALERVGKLLETGSREYDLAGRYGGEEFALFLPETDASTAMIIAERFRSTVEAIDDLETRITISLGATTIVPKTDWPQESCEELVEHLTQTADRALYQAKAGGRNRVVITEDHIY